MINGTEFKTDLTLEKKLILCINSQTCHKKPFKGEMKTEHLSKVTA